MPNAALCEHGDDASVVKNNYKLLRKDSVLWGSKRVSHVELYIRDVNISRMRPLMSSVMDDGNLEAKTATRPTAGEDGEFRSSYRRLQL
jgi:hypothetical protein